MKVFFYLMLLPFISLFGVDMDQNRPPPFLYKILSVSNWQASQGKTALQLSQDDAQFIHLAMESQVERIAQKYWADAPRYVVLKLETSKLQGRLVLEANPGGETKYYHLYQGSIPLKAVVEALIVENKK
jgi:uncharacterized protein (DUF952 family)